MEDGLQLLKAKLKEKIKQLDKRIETRNGPCYFDESKSIERLHSEASAFEKVLKMIDEIRAEESERNEVNG